MNDRPDDPRVVLFWIALICTILYLGIRQAKKRAKATGETFAKAFLSFSPPAFQKMAGAAGDVLDTAIYWWNKQDAFTLRDLLRSAAIFGASGSGKSSGSGFQLMKAIVSHPMTSMLILASKPEERDDVARVFARQRRLKDLLIFGPESPLRYNVLAQEIAEGADSRDLTKLLTTIGETLSRGPSGHGGDNEKFWAAQNERLIYNAVEVIRQSGYEMSAPNIQRFITGAATSQEQLNDPAWQKNPHNQIFAAAHAARKNANEENDYQIAREYWLGEYPGMDQRLRGSILAGAMGPLHTMITGVAREMLGTTTNISPRLLGQGKSILVDFPESRYGPAGALMSAVWKYTTQRYILRRQAMGNTPVTVLWCDEAQKVVNGFDSTFVAESRSHRGCMVYLTQSIHAYHVAMTRAGDHEADSFLTNFYTKIIHTVGDDKTAAYASSLLGKRLKGFASTTVQSGEDDVYDTLTGKSKSSASYSTRYENILQNRAFLQGMRTGGPPSYMVDGIVIRGEKFSNGENYLKVAFDQRG